MLNVSSDYLLGLIDAPLSSDEVAFVRKIYEENDPDKIVKEFEVYGSNLDTPITREELNKIIKKIKELDEVVHGDFFKKTHS